LVSLINGITLITLGLGGYYSTETPSLTAFISIVFGIIIILLNKGLKKENKVTSHVVVILTLLVLGGLLKPLLGGGFPRNDTIAL